MASDVRVSSVDTGHLHVECDHDFIVNKGEKQEMSQYTKVKDKGFEIIPFVIDSQGHLFSLLDEEHCEQAE